MKKTGKTQKPRKTSTPDPDDFNCSDNDDWEYFDDCPICQAMKDGRADTFEGLMAAFEEAKKIENTTWVKLPETENKRNHSKKKRTD